MGKPSETPLEKISLRLHKGDKDILNELYPVQGHNAIIRELVSNHIKQVKFVVNSKPKSDLDFGLEDLDIEQGDSE